MYIQIAQDGTLSLEDADNMKAFSIVEMVDAPASGRAATALLDIAGSAEAEHYWIDADAVIQLSPQRDNPQWVEAFWDMLKQVEAYGYSDLQNNRVKTHVETK